MQSIIRDPRISDLRPVTARTRTGQTGLRHDGLGLSGRTGTVRDGASDSRDPPAVRTGTGPSRPVRSLALHTGEWLPTLSVKATGVPVHNRHKTGGVVRRAMRYAELTLRASGGFHPADHAILESDALERVAISQFSHLDDGTVVLLYQLRGDPGPAEAVLDADPDVLGYGLSQTGTEVHARVHLAPNTVVETLTRLPRRYPLVVEVPVDCLRNGGLRAGVVGERETFAVAVETIPASVTVELASIRPYDPGTGRPAAALTARQQEILDAALAAGYYEVPRRTTHEEIAADLDIAPATVGEHLRKIESRVLTRVAGGVDTI